MPETKMEKLGQGQENESPGIPVSAVSPAAAKEGGDFKGVEAESAGEIWVAGLGGSGEWRVAHLPMPLPETAPPGNGVLTGTPTQTSRPASPFYWQPVGRSWAGSSRRGLHGWLLLPTYMIKENQAIP